VNDTPRDRGPTPTPAGAAERPDAKPRPQPLQVLGDPDATVCIGDACDIPTLAPEA
jgi:hypothetical protein